MGLATAALGLAAPGAAQATIFCVGTVPDTTCNVGLPGSPAGLQSALNSAEGNGQSDGVFVAAGTYVAPTAAGFNYSHPEQVQIVGAGQGTTILQGAPAFNAVAVDLSASGSSSSLVRDMTVRKAGTGLPTGVRLQDAQGVSLGVRENAPGTAGTGVELRDDGLFRDGSVFLSGDFGVQFPGAGTLRDSTVDAEIGATTSSGGSLTVQRSTITASNSGVTVVGSGVSGSVDNSRIRMTEVPTNGGVGAFTGGTLSVTDVTLVGEGTNVGAKAAQPGAGTATLNLDSSTVSGFVNELDASESGGGNAVINVSYSNYDDVGPGAGVVNAGQGNVNVTPGFIGPTPFLDSNHLLHSSPLIDMGNPASPPFGTLDRDGLDRTVDGNGSGGPRRDIGAFEYQRRAPTAVAVGPSSGKPSQALGYSSTGSFDPDPGDTLSYSWSFGDGASAAGASVSHSFGGGGVFGVKLTATDPTGLTGTATKQTAITAPLLPGGGAGSQATDSTAPVIRRLSMLNQRFRVTRRRTPLNARRRAKRGSAFRFRLSERAGVRIGIERPLRGARVRGKCRRPRGIVPRRRRCLRWKKVGATLRRESLSAGRHRVGFTGRFGRRKLSPGLYRASLHAVDSAGNRSKLVRVRFRVVK